jgi:O-glycosyl hydrolase
MITLGITINVTKLKVRKLVVISAASVISEWQASTDGHVVVIKRVIHMGWTSGALTAFVFWQITSRDWDWKL